MKYVFLLMMFVTLIMMPTNLSAQTVWPVSAGENKIDDAVFTAQPGDIIELTTNGGYYHEFFTIIIDKPLTIRAKEGLEVKPIWICDDVGRIITLLDDLTLEGITFIGSPGQNETERCIGTDSSGTGTGTKLDYKLKIDNCDFLNFETGSGRAIYANPYSHADSVIIKNSYFAHINNRAIYFKDPNVTPSVNTFIIENCTFWDIGEDVIYVDNFEDVLTTAISFYANHLTIHDPGTADPNIKSIYPKYIDGAIIKNSMVTRSVLSDVTDPARIYGANSVLEYFLYWNTDNISLREGATLDSTKLLINVDPLYFDESVGDFILNPSSQAVGFGENGTTLGDSRWFDIDRVTIDGLIGEWPEWTRLDTGAVNDPTLHDTTELKACWFTFDSNKVAMRADFFGPCDWRGGVTSGSWNINSGALRFYFYDPIGNKWRIRLYQNTIDSSFTRAKLLLEAGPNFPGLDTGRLDGIAQWNDAGTSVEMFFPGDSLAFPTSQWHPDSTLRARYWCLAGWGGQESRLPADGTYYWSRVSDVDFNNPPNSVEENKIGNNVPNKYKLFQNYPNPFNPVTNITYSISKSEKVQISIFNTLGQKIATLVNKKQTTGKHTIKWNARDNQGYKVASGVYYYQIEVDDFIQTKKMLLLR